MFDHVTDFFLRGGLFMIPLGACSLVAFTIIIERGIALRQATVINPVLAYLVDHYMPAQPLADIENAASQDGSSLGRLVSVVLTHRHAPRTEIVETVQMQARHELLSLERGLVVLEIIVGIAPLLGLLGTVSGLISIFANLGPNPLGEEGFALARGISEALNTTVAGLVIAVPTLTFLSYYSRKVEGLAAELESLCGELIGKLARTRPAVPAVPAPTEV